MPTKVIDASALAALLFGEPDSGRVVVDIGEDTLVAPQLISFEIASVCLKKIRAHPDRHEVFVAAFRMMDRLDIDLTSVDLAEVIGLAEHTGLTVYDACYLWLARLLKCEIITLDKRLRAASKR